MWFSQYLLHHPDANGFVAAGKWQCHQLPCVSCVSEAMSLWNTTHCTHDIPSESLSVRRACPSYSPETSRSPWQSLVQPVCVSSSSPSISLRLCSSGVSFTAPSVPQAWLQAAVQIYTVQSAGRVCKQCAQLCAPDTLLPGLAETSYKMQNATKV